MPVHLQDWEDLTPELVRVWGYDSDFLLLEQEEDLLLYRIEFLPVLLELVQDQECPKQTQAFNIVCQFCREFVLHRGKGDMAALQQAWSAISVPLVGRGRECHEYVRRLFKYAVPMEPMSYNEARRVAEDLLLGPAGRAGTVVDGTATEAGCWRFTLRTSVIEHVEVCATSGAISYTSYYSVAR